MQMKRITTMASLSCDTVRIEAIFSRTASATCGWREGRRRRLGILPYPFVLQTGVRGSRLRHANVPITISVSSFDEVEDGAAPVTPSDAGDTDPLRG